MLWSIQESDLFLNQVTHLRKLSTAISLYMWESGLSCIFVPLGMFVPGIRKTRVDTYTQIIEF